MNVQSQKVQSVKRLMFQVIFASRLLSPVIENICIVSICSWIQAKDLMIKQLYTAYQHHTVNASH